MKKFVAGLIAVLFVFMLGCATSTNVCYTRGDQKVCKVVKPYGVFDQGKENINIEYSVSIGNVIWSVLLCETIVVPVILVGWYLWEPDGPAQSEVITDASLSK